MTVDWKRAEALVVRAQRGDALAMSDLLDLTSPYVMAICRPIAGMRAEDAAQEALTVVFRRLSTLSDPAALRRWLRTVATREALRGGGEPVHEQLDEERTADPGSDAPELRSFLTTELARLPREQRAVLVLRELEGLSEREIAEVLDIARGTVKSRLARAKSRIRKAWAE